MKAKYKFVTVVERFNDPKNGVPRERLSCGHVKTDRILWDENVTAFKIKRAFESMFPEKPIKARCYKCGGNVPLAPVRKPTDNAEQAASSRQH